MWVSQTEINVLTTRVAMLEGQVKKLEKINERHLEDQFYSFPVTQLSPAGVRYYINNEVVPIKDVIKQILNFLHLDVQKAPAIPASIHLTKRDNVQS